MAHTADDCHQQAIADMIGLAFFFLLRPGEYTDSPSDTVCFRLTDVQLSIGTLKIDYATASIPLLQSATFATLTFTNQKNGVRGEVIGLGLSGNPLLCPVKILVRRLLHLRAHNAPLTTPLATCYTTDGRLAIKPADITASLRRSVSLIGPAALGFLPQDISARSLRASGAMALLCAEVDTHIIRLIGRWQSDTMLRYLHVQAEPVMRNFARNMLQHGDFVLHPNHDVPQLAQ